MDGDDYTWDGAGARFSLEDTLWEMEAARPGVDLRTADERAREEAARLHLRCDSLADAVEYLTGRVLALERTVERLVAVLEVRL